MIEPNDFAPIDDRVLIRALPVNLNPSSLIVIRENEHLVDFVGDGSNGEHNDNRRVGIVGVVVATGPGGWDEKKFKVQKMSVKPGDVVMFTAWNDLATLLPSDHYLIREGDIWGMYEA
jgi:co-chaperonin GroES (HSP10)